MDRPLVPVDLLSPSQAPGALALVALRGPRPRTDVPPTALVGSVAMHNGRPEWDSFEMSEQFRKNFAAYMRGELTHKPPILTEAKVAPGAHVYVIDGRVANPKGDVPFHEIIGWYPSDAHGRPVAQRFEHNAEHRFLSDQGFTSMVKDPNFVAWAFGA